jgi:hypothetical protein
VECSLSLPLFSCPPFSSPPQFCVLSTTSSVSFVVVLNHRVASAIRTRRGSIRLPLSFLFCFPPIPPRSTTKPSIKTSLFFAIRRRQASSRNLPSSVALRSLTFCPSYCIALPRTARRFAVSSVRLALSFPDRATHRLGNST